MMDTVFRNLLEVSLSSLAVIVPLGLCSNLLGRRYGVKWRYLLWVVVAACAADTAFPARAHGRDAREPACSGNFCGTAGNTGEAGNNPHRISRGTPSP